MLNKSRVFKTEAELKGFLMSQLKNVVVKMQEQVYQIIDRFIKEYYAEYTPVMYERTYQLYKSLVKSDIEKTANGYKAYVYVDLNSLDYNGHNADEKWVVQTAMEGYPKGSGDRVHGGYPTDKSTAIWLEATEILDKNAIDMFAKFLKQEGVKVV